MMTTTQEQDMTITNSIRRPFDDNPHTISITRVGDTPKLYHLGCSCGYYLRSAEHAIESIEQIAAEHKTSCDRQYAKRRQATTDRRIANYREARDICISALAKWNSTPLGANYNSLSGVRRMEYRRWSDCVEERIDTLRNLEGIDHRDIDAADGVNPLV
jgi:hypothetical protein